MQIKTIQSFHLFPVRMAVIKETNNKKILVRPWGEETLIQFIYIENAN
jgi:hypothetical protein